MKQINNIQCINFISLLLNNYKKLKLQEDEVIVILMIDNLINSGTKLVSNDVLARSMNYSESKIDDIMVSLLKKGYITFEESTSKKGALKTSIEPIKEKLMRELTKSILGNDVIKSEEEKQKIEILYKTFENKFKRSLAPFELSKIDEWLGSNYTCDDILFALRKAEQNSLGRPINIRAISKYLLQNKISNDIEEEGYSFHSTDSDLSESEIQEQIEILKTPWVKK